MAKNVTVVVPSDKTGHDILLAAIVTVLGSIAVGFIAAATAGKRQKRSLKSADDQHKDSLKANAMQHTESLDAEDRRLMQRLQHERKQQDVQNLRGFFDEIAMDYEHASAALNRFSALRKPPVSASETIDKAARDAHAAKLQVPIALDRVALWFGDNHDVFRSYEQVTKLINERYTFLSDSEGEFTPEQNDTSITLRVGIFRAFRSFTAAARTEIAGAVKAAESE